MEIASKAKIYTGGSLLLPQKGLNENLKIAKFGTNKREIILNLEESKRKTIESNMSKSDEREKVG
jgi:hypothetical protein